MTGKADFLRLQPSYIFLSPCDQDSRHSCEAVQQSIGLVRFSNKADLPSLSFFFLFQVSEFMCMFSHIGLKTLF